MKRNRLLFWATAISMLAEILLYLALVISVIVFIHWHLNREYYNSVEVTLKDGSLSISAGKSISGLSKSNKENISPDAEHERTRQEEKRYYFSDLNSTSFYFTCQLNTEEYPNSWRVFNSLGEAYTIDENGILAIDAYEKSVELNPENAKGIENLRRLKGK